MNSIYFEDFIMGSKYTTSARTVTETDIVLYAGLSGDYHPLHTDCEFAAKSPYGGRVAHGMLGSTIIMGFWSRLGLIDETGIGLLETNWKYVGPIRLGDTIHVEYEIAQLKPSSKPGRGTVIVNAKAINQRGEVAQEGEIVFIMKARG